MKLPKVIGLIGEVVRDVFGEYIAAVVGFPFFVLFVAALAASYLRFGPWAVVVVLPLLLVASIPVYRFVRWLER